MLSESEKLELLDAFNKYEEIGEFPLPGDFHSANATSVFKEKFRKAFYRSKSKDPKEAELGKEEFKKMRDLAKIVGLALGYGGTEHTVSRDLGISIQEAEKIVYDYDRGMPVFKSFRSRLVKDAHKTTFVKDLFGRIRYLPEINNNDNWGIRAYMERLAMNFPIQATGAEQLKLIIIALTSFIEQNRLNRHSGDLLHSYPYYTRIVTIQQEKLTEAKRDYIEQVEQGNCKLLVMDGDSVALEYTRPLRLTIGVIKDFGMEIYI